jgi:glucosamine kinase
MTDIIAVGIDAGGTNTRVRAVLPGTGEALTAEGPGANPNRAGLDAAAATLSDTVRQALGERTAAIAVCAGVAGAGRPDDQRSLAEAMARNLSTYDVRHVRVVHDGEIALEAAFEGGPGIIAIAGTGSLVLGRDSGGGFYRAGGWGYMIGDEGSGQALGAAAMRAVADAIDGGPETLLSQLARETYGITDGDELIKRVYREGIRLQDAARLLLDACERRDAVALRILSGQVELLTHQIALVAARMSDATAPVALIGGLSGSTVYREALEEALGRRLPEWPLTQPAGEPLHGAVRLARALIGT